ncbi:MAG: Glutamyl-tRNA(Gln) amidotransferase subunit C [Chlamydiae bacterium]|nr:Glutamyl-tRNA(Gln) amidotransferase subunit C [Chlamydiota bacterium]
MSELNEENLRLLCRLCMIKVDEKEIAELKKDLTKILDYVEQLREVDVSELAPYSHMEEQGIGSLRDDVVEKSLDHQTFIANAPDHIGGMIRVPPVISQDV